MIKEEAYNKMSEGYMVSHKLFSLKDYIYMDDQLMIRKSTGELFENEWDIITDKDWATDWFIYTGKHNKNIPPIIKISKVDQKVIPMIDWRGIRRDIKQDLSKSNNDELIEIEETLNNNNLIYIEGNSYVNESLLHIKGKNDIKYHKPKKSIRNISYILIDDILFFTMLLYILATNCILLYISDRSRDIISLIICSLIVIIPLQIFRIIIRKRRIK